MAFLDRSDYAAIFGPSAGDQIRLGDTDLWIEIEQDLTFGGEESVFGGGKSIRESMNQSLLTSAEGALDTVITNVVVLDHWGIVRADVGIREGRIVGIGRSGNPDIADGVDPALVIGPGTDVISGEGKILTAGGFDSHVHFLSPSQIAEALAVGLTTLGGGGTGPSEGSKATTVTPGAWHLKQTHRALDEFPVNLLLLGKGNTVSMPALEEQARAGAGGYKGHEGWGSTPGGIGAALGGAGGGGVAGGLHPGGHRRRAAGGGGVGAAGRAARGLAQRGRLRPGHRPGDRRSQHLGLPRRGSRRRARSGHPHDRRSAACATGLDQPDAAAHREHRGGAPRHADGLPPSQPLGAGGPRLRRVADPGHHDRGGGPPARPGCHLHHLLRRSGDGRDGGGDPPPRAGGARDEAGGG